VPAFRYVIDIAASPDQVWQVLGDLTSVDRWIPGLTVVRRTETGRVCTFEDGHVQDERILDYSPRARSYRYVIEGGPLPVRDNTGRFRVQAVDDQSRVVWESSFAALDPGIEPQLAQAWEPYLPLVLANLKQLVESGRRPGQPERPGRQASIVQR
jgi:carbon monoxide dehydrogenase subunit G